ncbi:hypothetical protein [Blastococcus sp. VKM Ac-2987]|uniref:hypothetical protein n=1 Tax=Blastococcus sp. VKM Ac-2987 TaxID=3004141 RepID=UPI0022AB6032|nr:hypothetical protein [Blastococcus sp. VKM Ac-2987]MCZ2857496.1 hypothetical protein [Blastococcus sp. VKM Ac-2987]
MRSTTQRQLTAVQRSAAHREVLIPSAGAPIMLSVSDGKPDRVAVVFLPGAMTRPLFHEDFLDDRSPCPAPARAASW